MDSLIKFEKNTLISVVSRIIFINEKITAYYGKSHTIEKKSQMSQNEPKMPIPDLKPRRTNTKSRHLEILVTFLYNSFVYNN
jgi:hypothetical protein